MSYTDQELETFKTYNQFADSWAGDHADMSHSRQILGIFAKFLPTGSVVEIGAGHGIDAEMLHDAGYEYLGTDAASGMVKRAGIEYPELTFKTLGVYDLPSLNRTFDGLWANAVLLHVPRVRIDEALGAMAAILRKGGVCFISIKAGSGEEFEVRQVAGRVEKRIFTFWNKDDFVAALDRNGFALLQYEYHPKNERSNWHHFFASKA